MKIVNIRKVSFKEATSEEPAVDKIVVHYNSNEVGDDAVGDTYIECTGLGENMQISATGYVLNSSDGVALKFADISNLGTADVIEADGIYLIMSGALERLELQCNGSADLVIKQLM